MKYERRPHVPDDQDRAAMMLRLVKAALIENGADSLASVGAVLSEIRDRDPAVIERLTAGIRARRAGALFRFH